MLIMITVLRNSLDSVTPPLLCPLTGAVRRRCRPPILRLEGPRRPAVAPVWSTLEARAAPLLAVRLTRPPKASCAIPIESGIVVVRLSVVEVGHVVSVLVLSYHSGGEVDTF